MTQRSPLPDESADGVRQPIVLKSETTDELLDGDRTLESVDAPEAEEIDAIRKPIVLPVEPPTEEEDGDRGPKNTNLQGL